MSKVKCMRCDKCGELIIGDDPHGTFRGALWPSEIESFDLCRDCSVEVPVSACTLLVRCGCAGGGKGALVSDEVSLTLSTSNTQTLFSYEGGDMVVRRLTPRECERLQGFPDDWTKIPYRGKPADECPDGPRYKAVGNSMAVPVMRWIGKRIAMAEAGEIS